MNGKYAGVGVLTGNNIKVHTYHVVENTEDYIQKLIAEIKSAKIEYNPLKDLSISMQENIK